jgi:hypothetical protein
MAKRYLNTIVSRLKTSSPKTHVRPSNGSSMADALRPSFAFLNVPTVIIVVAVSTFVVGLTARVAPTLLEDRVLCKAMMKIAKLI